MLKIFGTNTSIIKNKDSIEVKVDGKYISSDIKYFLKSPYKYCNMYINDFTKFSSICNEIRTINEIPVNLILNGIKLNQIKEPKKIVEGFKMLPSNIKISYKKLTEDKKVINSYKKLIIDESVENREYESINPWLTNLSKDDFEFMVTKFNDDEKRYILMQDQIIKHVYDVIKNTNKDFDDLDDHEKIDIVFNYLNTHIKLTDDNNDPIESAMNKKGDIESIKKLFVILTNNRRMKLKTSYVDGKLIHGLHYYDKFDEFVGKKQEKTL